MEAWNLPAPTAAGPLNDAPAKCETPCDDDCPEVCHEIHHVWMKRCHEPQDCPGLRASIADLYQ